MVQIVHILSTGCGLYPLLSLQIYESEYTYETIGELYFINIELVVDSIIEKVDSTLIDIGAGFCHITTGLWYKMGLAKKLCDKFEY